jgi:hypothetical protein
MHPTTNKPTHVTILNMAQGGWYPKGQQRLLKSLKEKAPYAFTYFTNEPPEGCPSHYQAPYAFKPAMFEAAHTTPPEISNHILIWMDSSTWVQHDIKPLIDIIKAQGYLIFENAGKDKRWDNAQWCNDRSIQYFGYKRHELKQTPHANAMVIGFNLNNPKGATIFNQWASCIDLYPGNWTNENFSESNDPYCLGHRHDQSILSLVALKENAILTPEKDLLSRDKNDKKAIILAEGM